MPELPEVETIRRQLEQTLKGKKILQVEIFYPKAIRPLKLAEFSKRVADARFSGFGRRAKILQLHLTNGNTVLVHLKMTGRLLYEKRAPKPRKQTEVVFRLANKEALFYDDLRRFGWLRIIPTKDASDYFDKEGYGPEPLEPGFTAAKMALCLRAHPKRRLKQLLMEQTCIAGIGNIYADESLWEAGIMPSRRVGDVTDVEIKKLFQAIRKTLTASIKRRGTSSNDYLDLLGRKGENARYLKAYGQKGKKCGKGDGGVIKKITLGGRGTHFCPVHQR